jgi:hypothetical protein
VTAGQQIERRLPADSSRRTRDEDSHGSHTLSYVDVVSAYGVVCQ